jgi:glycosyltransferase involved in cell wall biosynthesis
MQEIKKRRIVLASVLKPVDDNRMVDKIGRTLASVHHVDVIGFDGAQTPVPGITQHSIGKFSRISIARFLAPWKILKIILRLKPDLLIVCTHELLLQAMLVKAITGGKVWYDVQENYSRNILKTDTFPVFIKPVLAGYIRLKEKLVFPWIDKYLLAEASYVNEMKYLQGKSIPLENKSRLASRARADIKTGRKKLLFTGTLSTSTGVFVAIEITKALHNIDKDVTLTIIGYCAHEGEYENILSRCLNNNFITLIGGNELVPHSKILEAIGEADVGIISYPANSSTWDSMPTKLYEYLANRLPILLVNNPKWVDYCRQFDAAVVFDPNKFLAVTVYENLGKNQFYSTDPQDVYWESLAPKLLSMI